MNKYDEFGNDDEQEHEDDLTLELDEKQGLFEDAISERDKIENRLKELEATPGFMDGKLKVSRNPADREKHEEILEKRRKLLELQNAEPEISAEDLTDEGQALIQKELVALEATPGFLDGVLKTSAEFTDRERHAELLEKWHNLIARLSPEAHKADMKAMETQGNRIKQAETDLNELVEKHGYEKASVPRNVTERQVAGLRLQLLSAKGDFDGLARYAFSAQKRAGFSDEQVNALTNISKLNLKVEKKQKIYDELLLALFEKD